MPRSPEPLSIQLYQELKRRIITGVYPQGMRLTEQFIAEELKVSRIPLREVIPRLKNEGFLQAARQGIAVRVWSATEVNDLFDARLALEGQAAWLAALRVGAGGDAQALAEAFEEAERISLQDDALETSLANARFHEALVEASGNALLVSLMAMLTGQMAWLFYLTAQRNVVVACAEHRSITEAIGQGNGLLARALTEAHIEIGRRPTFEILDRMR